MQFMSLIDIFFLSTCSNTLFGACEQIILTFGKFLITINSLETDEN